MSLTTFFEGRGRSDNRGVFLPPSQPKGLFLASARKDGQEKDTTTSNHRGRLAEGEVAGGGGSCRRPGALALLPTATHSSYKENTLKKLLPYGEKC